MENTFDDTVAAACRALGYQKSLPDGFNAKRRVVLAGVAYAVLPTDSAALIQTLTDNAIIALDAITGAAFKGFEITLQNTGAAGAALIAFSPAAADKVKGTVVGGATGVPVTSGGVLNKDWRNTKATSIQGDYCRIVYDGVDTWWIVDGTGVWASEP